jgi:glycosyltransferase involved in cell wall biosynthesis
VNYFAQKGHEVHLISSRFSEGYDGYDKRIEMHPLTILLPQMWKVSRYLSGCLWLFQARKLLREIRPDILNAHFITIFGYLGAISGFHPLVLTAWGSDILIYPKKNPIHGFLTKQTLRRVDGIICVSPVLKEGIIKLGGALNKIEMTTIGIDTQKFGPGFRNEVLLRELEIGDSPVVINTRHLDPIYDVETLIKSIPLVLHEVPEAKFIIAGEGEQRSYLESLTQSSGVSSSVRFIGWISNNELPDYLASSDVYVSTSLSDGTSISLLEALASELAPVVTDIPANRPWVNDGDNGFLVPTGDYKMLASKIVQLLKDSEARTRFGKIGRNMVVERAEHENEMSRVEEIYEGLRFADSN